MSDLEVAEFFGGQDKADALRDWLESDFMEKVVEESLRMGLSGFQFMVGVSAFADGFIDSALYEEEAQ